MRDMKIQVAQTNIRQTPRKIRQVADVVRGMSVEQAIAQLSVIQRKSSLVLLKMIRQGLADATHNHGWSVSDIVLDSIVVEGGPVYKRFNAVSRGRAHSIQKKTSHVKMKFSNGATARSEKVTENSAKTQKPEKKTENKMVDSKPTGKEKEVEKVVDKKSKSKTK